MLWKSRELRGLRLGAKDGQIGHLKDLYFDDQSWTVRYLVADTGNWLPHRKVLISPYAVTAIHTGKAVDVNLTRQQIEDCPSIETHRPVSRQYEARFHQYYGWPYYWPGPLLWGPVAFPGPLAPENVPTEMPPLQAEPTEPQEPHLRSEEEVAGYTLQALDDHFGHIEQLIVDDRDWAIRYLVADTRNWWPGKRVLVAPQWISSVSWSELSVYLDLDRETVQRGPEYTPARPITREYEQQLYEHYNREPYWESSEKPNPVG